MLNFVFNFKKSPWSSFGQPQFLPPPYTNNLSIRSISNLHLFNLFYRLLVSNSSWSDSSDLLDSLEEYS